jgi:hypothetical protein
MRSPDDAVLSARCGAPRFAPTGEVVAGIEAVHSVGSALTSWLRNRYPATLTQSMPCSFRLLSSTELAQLSESPGEATCALYLHRMATDPLARHAAIASGQRMPLALTLHYLVTFVAAGALAEHTIAAWVARELHEHSLLDASVLSTAAEWLPEEQLRIEPDHLPPETLARIWESFRHTHRLTLPYLVRTVRIEPSTQPDTVPVVAVGTGLGTIAAVKAAERLS